MKRIFALIVGLSIIASSAFASAGSLTVQNSETAGVSFAGTGFDKNIPLKLEILKKGNGENKLGLINDSNAEDYILYAEVLYTDDGGAFSFSTPAADKAAYFYHLSALGGFAEGGYVKDYSDDDYENAALTFLAKEPQSRTEDEAKELFESFCLEYRLNYDILDTLTEAQCDYITGQMLLSEADSEEAFTKNVSLLAALARMNNAPDASAMKALISENYDVLGVEKTFFYEDYLSLEKTGENEIDATVNVCGRLLDDELTKENYEGIFKENILIELVKQGLWNEVSGFLSDYSSVVSVDLTDFSKASSEIQKSTQVKFKAAVAEDLSVSTWPADFIKCYNDAVAENNTPDIGENGSSNNGVSSTGGKNSSLGKAPVYSAGSNAASAGDKDFTDIQDVPWAQDAIEFLSAQGIISGKGNRLFYPSDNVKREEIVKMIVEALDIKAVNEGAFSRFADVPEDVWFSLYIRAAVDAGITNGISENKFGAGVNVTRQDMAVMLYRAFASKLKAQSGDANAFSDNSDIAAYAAEAVNVLSAAGIVKGTDGKFLPNNMTTRAEAAVMLYRLLSL